MTPLKVRVAIQVIRRVKQDCKAGRSLSSMAIVIETSEAA